MRNYSFKSAVVAGLAALTLVTSAAAAGAQPMWPHGHWHHGFGYGHGWGPGIAFGVAGAAIAAGACLRTVPVYDPWGNYVGSRVINVCY